MELVDIVTEVEGETGPESKAYGTLCFGFLGLDLGGRELRWASCFFFVSVGVSMPLRRGMVPPPNMFVVGRVLGGGSRDGVGGGVVGRLFIFYVYSHCLVASAAQRGQ